MLKLSYRHRANNCPTFGLVTCTKAQKAQEALAARNGIIIDEGQPLQVQLLSDTVALQRRFAQPGSGEVEPREPLPSTSPHNHGVGAALRCPLGASLFVYCIPQHWATADLHAHVEPFGAIVDAAPRH